MGIEVLEAEFGKSVITMTLRQEMLNGFGIAHGGMIFAFADTAFALACNKPEGDSESITVASGADINFVSSGQAGEKLTATAVVRERFGRSGLYDIRVSGADNRTIAEFRGRSRTIPNLTQVHKP
ncbi:MAG: hydroxyphenylacetyl-CoA thioesterase PaaI [Rothia sp. (in: high G+C Gram-positive bacteria)]|nr:hydroxyphenylacetyl-CoA thioesterase PaaI [Rothia sp. (in: high G+C Gram-positive bacteria)]